MPASPNVDNISLFKGIVKYMKAGSGSYRDLGECLTFTTTMTVQTLEYQSRRHSTRIPVKIINLGKTLVVALTMSEFSPENFEMWAMGTNVGSPPVTPIGSDAEVRGALRVIGENTVGQTFQLDLYDVSLRPNGALAWLADADWSEMILEGTANADTVTGKFGDIQPITAGAEIPMGSPPI
jgi:hypothetical protein